METLIFLNMGIVFSPSKMKTKRSFRRKLVTFIKMYTKTRNNRKKRSKRTNTTKDKEKPREQNCQSMLPCKLCFTVVLFCFNCFAHFSAFVLVVWVVLLLFWKPGFVSLLRVFVKIIYISFIITLKLGSSHLNSSVYYRIKFDS